MRSTILDVQDLCEDMYNEVIACLNSQVYSVPKKLVLWTGMQYQFNKAIIVEKEQFASVIMLNFILTLLITFFEKMPYWSNLINLKNLPKLTF